MNVHSGHSIGLMPFTLERKDFLTQGATLRREGTIATLVALAELGRRKVKGERLEFFVHNIEDIAIERDEFGTWHEGVAKARKIALPLAHVDLGEDWVTKYGPSGINANVKRS